jgi:colanic acid/amylovoran biosynthesis glycosyltransferase
VDRCLVNTEFAKKQAAGLGCDEEKIHILPQGIDLKEFPYVPRQAPQQPEPTVLLTVSRLHKDKGHKYAIDAVKGLIASGHRVAYRIVGNGPEQMALKDYVRNQGLEKVVLFLGSVTDEQLRQELCMAHIFLLPSLKDSTGHHIETQGVVLQEAMASGKIVVASQVGGIPESMDFGRKGFLVPDRDSSTLAQVIADITYAPQQWSAWQHEGRVWVEKYYDIHKIGCSLMKHYESVVNNRKSDKYQNYAIANISLY